MNSKGRYIESNENETERYNGSNHSSNEKIRFLKNVINKEVMFNLQHKESIDTNLFNKCSRDFIESEKGNLVYNVRSEITSSEINHLKNQNILLKQLIAELSHENEILKNSLNNNRGSKIANE